MPAFFLNCVNPSLESPVPSTILSQAITRLVRVWWVNRLLLSSRRTRKNSNGVGPGQRCRSTTGLLIRLIERVLARGITIRAVQRSGAPRRGGGVLHVPAERPRVVPLFEVSGRGLHSGFECAGRFEFEFSEDGEAEEGEDDDAAYCAADDEDCFGVGAAGGGRGGGFGGCGGGRGGGCGGGAGRGGLVLGVVGGGGIGLDARGCDGVARGRGDGLGLWTCGRLLFCLLTLLGRRGLRGRDDDLCCRRGGYSLDLDDGLCRVGVDID